MALIGKIVIGLQTNLGSFSQGLSDSVKGLTAWSRQVRGPAAAAEKSLGAVGEKSGLKGLGRDLLLGFGAFKLASGAFDFFQKGVRGASDLNESVGASRAVFGDFFGRVEAQADGMTRAFGVSKKAQLDVAAAFGSIAQGSRYSGGDVAAFANTFTRLAADLGSFKNIPFEEAAQKIQAALAGEAEPLRRFGVMIDEAAVKQEALRLGLSRSGKDLDQHSRMVARAALIQRGLSDASGDLARTAGSAANQFRQAGGGLDRFAEMMGEVLLPAVQSGTSAFNELLASVIEAFEANRPMIEGWGEALKGVFDGVGVAVRNSGTVWRIFQLRVGEVASNVVAYVAVIPANLQRIGEYIAGNWRALVTDAVDAVGQVFANLGRNLRDLAAAIFQYLKDPTQGFRFDWTPLLKGFEATAGKLPEMIRPELISVQGEIDRLQAEMTAAEAKRLGSIRAAPPAAPKPAAVAAAPGPGPGAPKFAGALELGTAEARSAVLKAQFGAGADRPARETARNTAKSVELQGRMAVAMEAMARRAGGAGDHAPAVYPL